jgi:hypothetical protein
MLMTGRELNIKGIAPKPTSKTTTSSLPAVLNALRSARGIMYILLFG